MKRAFILADVEIGPEHIVLDDNMGVDASESANVPAGAPLEDIERMAIENTLAELDGNRAKAAKQLGISVKTLYNKL